MNSQNTFISFFTLSCLALLVFAGQAFAQGGGSAIGTGEVAVTSSDGLNSTVSARFDVSWEPFVVVNPNIRRANIVEANVQTNFFNVETQFGPDTWIEIRRDNPGNLYWVWVCHRVRVCYWPCPGCCIPVWRVTCWRSHLAVADWVPGLDLTMELQEDQNFNNLTISAEGTSFNIIVP